MITLRDIKIDTLGSLGHIYVLLRLSPLYDYAKDGRRLDERIGTKYEVACPEKMMRRITVKILGPQTVTATANELMCIKKVKFTGLEAYLYQMNGELKVGARAKKIDWDEEAHEAGMGSGRTATVNGEK